MSNRVPETTNTVMKFSFKFPPSITSLDNLLMVMLYIRKYNKQKNTKFESVNVEKEGVIAYKIRHKTPPILKALLHIDLEEHIDTSEINAKTNPCIISNIISIKQNSLCINTYTKYYVLPDRSINAITKVDITYLKKSLPKILKWPVLEWTKGRTQSVRNCEIETYRELFS